MVLRFSLTLSLLHHSLPFVIYYLLGIYASLSAIRQTDLKKLLLHLWLICLVTLGIFVSIQWGLKDLLFKVNHGFVSGGMFLLGKSYMSVILSFLYYFGGLVHIMPVYAVLVVLQWLILHYGYKQLCGRISSFRFIKQM
jgi:hypothetical protein